MLGLSHQTWDYDFDPRDIDQQAYRPGLPFDNNGANFPSPQYHLPPSQSSNTPIGFDGLSSHGGERIITPGPAYNYVNNDLPLSFVTQAPELPQNTWPTFYSNESTYFNPDLTFFHPPHNTICPTELGRDSMPKATQSFSDLMMDGRGSSSSASSNDGPAERSGNSLMEWSRPPQRAVIIESQAKPHFTGKPKTSISQPVPLQASHHVQPFVELPFMPPPTDLETAMKQYITTPNRLAFGERKITVMSPKVGQKSYGTEKRFLCPHPQAALVGHAWWTQSKDECPISPIHPPTVNVSLAGEQPVKDSSVSWTTVIGRNLDERIKSQAITQRDKPFHGTVAGKNLHITGNDEKRREVKALVTVKMPPNFHAGQHGWGPAKGTVSDIKNDRVIGIFESKEIKVISKPSKKKSNNKSGERESSRCDQSSRQS